MIATAVTSLSVAAPGILFALGAVGLVVGLQRHRGRPVPDVGTLHTEARRDVVTRGILLTAVAGLAFQVFHVAEHGLQLGYWLLHPTQAPWLTPWAAWGRDAIASQVDGQAATGAELLHLVGNVLFLVALVAMLVAVARTRLDADRRSATGPRRRTTPPSGQRSLRIATWIQTAHVAEHVLLTWTWMALGQANGVSNLFGLVPSGPVGGATRVWVHFTINAVATYWAVRGMRESGLVGPGTPRVSGPAAAHRR